jgi:hypothetical protein
MECRMDKMETRILPNPPNIINSLRKGFDAITNQFLVILIPIAIDLLLWLGPHLQVKRLVDNFIDTVGTSTAISPVDSGGFINSNIELLRTAAAQFNLLSLLRTIPVGIPSLMATRLPLSIPTGSPPIFDVTNSVIAILISVSLILAGLVAGCFYYILVGQAALSGKIELRKFMKNWSWTSLQVISLALALLILFLLVSIPSSCAFSAIALFGLPLGQFAVFLYIGVLFWLAVPLLFSAHGIFVNHNNALVSVQKSMILTRMTLPTTSLFFLAILIISEGLDMLWRTPPETSWITLVGVGGHAFISTALLAASFVYYRDADHWVQETLRSIKTQKEISSQV